MSYVTAVPHPWTLAMSYVTAVPHPWTLAMSYVTAVPHPWTLAMSYMTAVPHPWTLAMSYVTAVPHPCTLVMSYMTAVPHPWTLSHTEEQFSSTVNDTSKTNKGKGKWNACTTVQMIYRENSWNIWTPTDNLQSLSVMISFLKHNCTLLQQHS